MLLERKKIERLYILKAEINCDIITIAVVCECKTHVKNTKGQRVFMNGVLRRVFGLGSMR